MKFEKYFDHTNLKPEATKEDIIRLCEEAKEYGFASICVNSIYTELVSKCLEGTDVATCVVVGFPLGAMDSESKAFETRKAVEHGADEIDMVISVGALKEKNYDYVYEDIKAVREACEGKVLKVILENCLLEKEEIVKACELSVKAKADYVKTSTGFSTGGATITDVALMKETVNGNALVKAAGGIRDYNTAKAMIEAGADRIGASATIKIVKENN